MNERSSIIDSDDPTEEEIPVAEAADTDGNQYPVWLELEVPEDPRIKSSVPAPVPVAKLSVSPRTQPLPSNPPLVYGLNAKVLFSVARRPDRTDWLPRQSGEPGGG
jgi:hypothetical protein